MVEMEEDRKMKEAAAEVSRLFKTMLNSDDVSNIQQLQHLILGRLQDSNAVLSHFNEYSEGCLGEAAGDFSRHTHLVKSMNSDLHYIFHKLRRMKEKIGASFPDAIVGADGSTEDPHGSLPHLQTLQPSSPS